MSPQRAVIVILCCITLIGCGSYFAPDRNLERKVTESEVVGTWKLTPESLALLQRDGFVGDPSHLYMIMFDDDGGMRFASVRDDFQGGTYYDVMGEWELEHDTKGNSNVLKSNALRYHFDADGKRFIRYLNFTEDRGELLLWNYYGDPDSWEFMEYERE